MVDWVEVRGKTVDVAVAAGMQELGVSDREGVDVEVIQEPERGFLGLGGRDAIVHVKPRPQGRNRRRRRGRDGDRTQTSDRRPGPNERTERRGADRPAGSQAPDRQGSDRQGSDRQGSDRQGSDRQSSGRQGSDRQGTDRRGSGRQGSDGQSFGQNQGGRGREQGGRPVNRGSSSASSRGSGGGGRPPRGGSEGGRSRSQGGREGPRPVRAILSEADLNQQAPMVEEFLTGLVDSFGLDGQVEVRIDEDVIIATIEGEQTEALVGPRGSVMESIHEITKTVLHRQVDDTARVRIDIAGYAERRRQALSIYANQLINQVMAEGGEIMLEPMSAADRKVIHDAVAGHEGVESYSEGEPPRRFVVIATTGEQAQMDDDVDESPNELLDESPDELPVELPDKLLDESLEDVTDEVIDDADASEDLDDEDPDAEDEEDDEG